MIQAKNNHSGHHHSIPNKESRKYPLCGRLRLSPGMGIERKIGRRPSHTPCTPLRQCHCGNSSSMRPNSSSGSVDSFSHVIARVSGVVHLQSSSLFLSVGGFSQTLQVDFLNWKNESNLREIEILRRYHIQKREDYVKYNQ